MTTPTIIYEQPLNELVRVCLRLEQLFHQIDHHIADTSTLGTRNVIGIMISLLQLLDRPDIKAKLAKELSHQHTVLSRLKNTPKIDHTKLKELLEQLDSMMRGFIDSSGKIGQNLREIELLSNLRLHLASPGGGCSFDIPVYHYWLQQPAEERISTIKSWLTEFNYIRNANETILTLIRESAKTSAKTAEQGFYQEPLDPQFNLRLVRVTIPEHTHAYPEISVGRHLLSVRFITPHIHNRPTQFMQNVSFWLTHCSA